jgi:LmbE family N-acetylglucosaminyl deacetylase
VKTRAAAALRGHVAILSPHLDDAVYSLGAAIRESARAGAHVTVITVFSGDPSSTRPASRWDRRFGFRLAGEAARARRDEDRRACALLGASVVWLPFDDEHGTPAGADEVSSALKNAVGDPDLVLIPGFPLDHSDHLRLAVTVLERPWPGSRFALYAEQPYAAVQGAPPSVPGELSRLVPGEPEWCALEVGGAARLRKARAWRAYRSQFRHFGYRSLVNVMRYEVRHGGELMAFL